MLLYRLPEAMCIKLVQPFLVAPRDTGGLGLTTAEVGFVNGTVGVIALLAGGILGGLAIARDGLKAWLWPMALSLTLPCAFYCWLAISQPTEFSVDMRCRRHRAVRLRIRVHRLLRSISFTLPEAGRPLRTMLSAPPSRHSE